MDELTHMTPTQIYDKLVTDYEIKSVTGGITFYLGEVGIVVKQKDVIGNLIQEWLEGWLRANKIYFTPNPNTQMPPDVFLNEDRTKDLLEVKAFNSSASPAFDVADFISYTNEIISKPYMLHTKYLIFAYKMDDDGEVTIKDIWLKNVWEICRSMADWAVNVQVNTDKLTKAKTIKKIRPATWYRSKGNYPTFQCLEDFISALEETLYYYRREIVQNGWQRKLKEAYFKHYGVELTIPRWSDISHKYRLQ